MNGARRRDVQRFLVNHAIHLSQIAGILENDADQSYAKSHAYAAVVSALCALPEDVLAKAVDEMNGLG